MNTNPIEEIIEKVRSRTTGVVMMSGHCTSEVQEKLKSLWDCSGATPHSYNKGKGLSSDACLVNHCRVHFTEGNFLGNFTKVEVLKGQ